MTSTYQIRNRPQGTGVEVFTIIPGTRVKAVIASFALQEVMRGDKAIGTPRERAEAFIASIQEEV